MIDVKEHVYHDDPKQGHPDVRTYLKDVHYFFIGNGRIQAAVQYAPGGEGSRFGLIIMNPEKLRRKREALSFDPEEGLEQTALTIQIDGKDYRPDNCAISWSEEDAIPTVVAEWSAGDISVTERFFCCSKTEPAISREVLFQNHSDVPKELKILTGVRKKVQKIDRLLPGSASGKAIIEYALDSREVVNLHEVKENTCPDSILTEYWQNAAQFSFTHPVIDHLFKISTFSLPAAVSASGVVDASIWQYAREWVRDHSFMILGLIMSGHHALARTMLQRLIDEFISDEGDAMDSSERRTTDEVELDQNGLLLYTVHTYYLWTGDEAFIRSNWDKLVKVAEFPLQEIFRHPESGLLCNRRDYWERHAAHGIETGMELTYQFFPVLGLRAGAELAKLINMNDIASRWLDEADKLDQAIIHHPTYAMHDARGFIKRRGLDGTVQEAIIPRKDSGLPAGVPLSENTEHFLNPDSAASMAIAYGFISPDSPLAIATMSSLEALWNQQWDIGGYCRYNVTSEPDSRGPWPFASLYIARAYHEMGEYEKVWRVLNWLNEIPGSLSGSWFEMYGERISPPFAQIGITPWTWGEMIMLMVRHILGIQPTENGFIFRPRLLPGMNRITGSIPFRGRKIILDISVDPQSGDSHIEVNGKTVDFQNGAAFVQLQACDCRVKMF